MLSAVFITDLSGKPLISRNYRGDIPLTSAIEKFASYLLEVDGDLQKPVFHVDSSGEFVGADEMGSAGVGGETFVYVQVRPGGGEGREGGGRIFGLVQAPVGYRGILRGGSKTCGTSKIPRGSSRAIGLRAGPTLGQHGYCTRRGLSQFIYLA